MTIDTTAATSSTTVGQSNPTTAPAQPGGVLGENQFLELMMTQMKTQDPLNPSDPSQYLSELAQFTGLEQMTNVAQSTAQALTAQNTSAAVALIGHTVSYTDSSGSSVTGTVQKVNFTASGPTLTIDGQDGVSPGSVIEVQ